MFVHPLDGTMPLIYNIDTAKATQWIKEAGADTITSFRSEFYACHPRVPAVAPSGQAAIAFNTLPTTLKLLTQNATGGTADLQLFRQSAPATYASVAYFSVTNSAIINTYNTDSTRYKLTLLSGTTLHRLDLLQAWNIIDLAPYLDDFAHYRTTSESAIFTPISPHPLVTSKTEMPITARIICTIPRSETLLLQTLRQLSYRRIVEIVETVNGTDYHLPATIESLNITPSGVLLTIDMQLRIPTLCAYNPIRQTTPDNINSWIALYNATSDITPAEIRLSIQAIEGTNPVEVHLTPSDQHFKFVPDAPGIYSITETGRLYYLPFTTQPAPLTDKTHLLTGDTPPPLLHAGDNMILWQYAPVIDASLCAYHPRLSLTEFA